MKPLKPSKSFTACRIGLCAAVATLLTAHLSSAANYTWTSTQTRSWNDTTKWVSDAGTGSYPNAATDNVTGNTGVAVANLNSNYTIGDFTATTTGWTIQGAAGVGTVATFNVNKATANTGISMSFRSTAVDGVGTQLLSLEFNTLDMKGGTFNLGIATAGQALSDLTVHSGILLNAGTISVNAVNNYSLGLISVSGNGTINLSASNVGRANTVRATVSGLTGTGTGTIRAFGAAGTSGNNAAMLLINNASNYSSGILLENGPSTNTITSLGVIKQGQGTQALTRANTYTGGTTIDAGTLLANNTTGSALGTGAITVNADGTLGGTGSVSGVTTVSGAIAPGDAGIESLAITNDVTWNGGVAWKFELSNTDLLSDRLLITGVDSDFLKGTGAAWTFDFSNTGVLGNTYTLVDWDGTTTFTASNFSYTGLTSGLTGSFELNGSQLDFVVVPEPATWAMLIGGMGMLGFAQRIRRRALR